MIQTADKQQNLGDQCLDSASVEAIELILQYGANPDAICDTRSPEERRQITEIPNAFMSIEEILGRVHPDKSRLLTLLAEARERRAERQRDVGIPGQQDTDTTWLAWDPQSTVPGATNDVEFRSDCPESASGVMEPRGDRLEARSGGVELPRDRSETPGESMEPRIGKPELRKRKRRWRLWEFLKRILI